MFCQIDFLNVCRCVCAGPLSLTNPYLRPFPSCSCAWFSPFLLCFPNGRRSDGVAFDAKGKQCVFLEFTCPMVSVTSSDEGDWAERKELEKNERYVMHLYFIKYLSSLNGRPWNCSQANFTVGGRGSLKRSQFKDRLCLLRVTESKAIDKIRALTVSIVAHYPQAFLRLYSAQP